MKYIFKVISGFIIVFFITSFSFFVQDQNLEYRNGNQFMKLIVFSENPYLSLNQSTKLKLKLENIEAETLTVSGKGLSSLGYFQTNTQLMFKVTVDEKSAVDGKWELNITEMEKGKVKWHHKFIIPVK